ncbi:MAG: glycosyl hydrolase family 18 protein [Patescibacteria group bacterium]|nr:glycosyl hydrolase family 18 protein [Patescibacteria group bacterium]
MSNAVRQTIYMHMIGRCVALTALVFLGLPFTASAATPSSGGFEVSGWIPYWRAATGTIDVLPHLDDLTEVNPFVYTLKNDGTLSDNGNLDEEPWKSFIAAARAKKVRVIPTVMTGNGALLHKILSDTASRIALEDRIADLVKEKGFDGIEIDFEGKYAADKDYFSTFLKGLYQRMGNKWVMCDIEARTPIGSRYYGTDTPPDAGIYANDLVEINKYCDRVKIMAYDQQGIDLALSAAAASSSQLYAPVADPLWVEKVVNLMARDIDRSKILIGVPTYGYEYDVTVYAGSDYVYKILWTFNPGYALPIAAQYGVMPQRNTAGEIHFTYTPTDSGTAPVVAAPMSALLAATAASLYADSYNSHLTFRLMDWPDAASIAQKVALAKKLGVRGIAIFKLDGGQDPNMWGVLKGVASQPVATSGSVSSASAFTRGLDFGATGDDVRRLQELLNTDTDTLVAESGAGSPGRETSYFGPATTHAVEKFQIKYGIAKAGNPGYGYVGPKTRAKLNQQLAGL